MQARYDVVIAGGAAVGSSIAYHLAASPDFDGTVLVVERDSSYSTCATGRSWGVFRQQFTTAESIQMSLYGGDFYHHVADHLAVDGDVPDLGLVEAGLLLLADEANWATVKVSHALQCEHGAAVELLTPDELLERFPELSVDGVVGASFGYRNEGWIDPMSLLNAFRRKARALGSQYVVDEVVSLSRHGRRITGVELRDGGIVEAGVVVNAAGIQAAAVAAMAGIDLPVVPYQMDTFVFDCARAVDHRTLTVDPSGLILRPEGRGFITSLPPGPEGDPWTFDLEVDYEDFEARVWPLLAARIPAFESVKMRSAWAGAFEYNTFDRNAILGPHPEVDGLLFANGFSGHGLQHSPATGRAITELIAHREYRSLDLRCFGFERIIENRPMVEVYAFGSRPT